MYKTCCFSWKTKSLVLSSDFVFEMKLGIFGICQSYKLLISITKITFHQVIELMFRLKQQHWCWTTNQTHFRVGKMFVGYWTPDTDIYCAIPTRCGMTVHLSPVNFFFFKINLFNFWILWSSKKKLIVKITNFRGDLSDISAKTATLLWACLVRCRLLLWILRCDRSFDCRASLQLYFNCVQRFRFQN